MCTQYLQVLFPASEVEPKNDSFLMRCLWGVEIGIALRFRAISRQKWISTITMSVAMSSTIFTSALREFILLRGMLRTCCTRNLSAHSLPTQSSSTYTILRKCSTSTRHHEEDESALCGQQSWEARARESVKCSTDNRTKSHRTWDFRTVYDVF